jgi:hypothetical protein
MTPNATPSRRWVKPLARMGYAARGIVYLIIAFFTMVAALGSGGEAQDTRGAIETLTRNDAGNVLTIALILGLAGYSLWRFIQSIFDTDDHGLSPKGAAVRAGLLTSGTTYAVLTLFTFSLWRGSGDRGGGGDVAEWLSAFIGARPTALVLAAVFAGVAIAHIAKAWRQGYRKHIEAPQRAMRVIDPVAMTGLSARGMVFVILSILLLTRGLQSSGEGSTPGLGDALDYVTGLPFGSVLLGFMSLGLAAFAFYSLIEAVWRRINVEDA